MGWRDNVGQGDLPAIMVTGDVPTRALRRLALRDGTPLFVRESPARHDVSGGRTFDGGVVVFYEDVAHVAH